MPNILTDESKRICKKKIFYTYAITVDNVIFNLNIYYNIIIKVYWLQGLLWLSSSVLMFIILGQFIR